jgi:uncharacterized membrane protein YqjE
MSDNNHTTGLGTLASKIGKTTLGALTNRGELLAVEWQQERARLTQLLILAVGLMFLGMMGALLLTATIIYLFHEEYRLYVAAGFTILYLGGAGFVFFKLRALVNEEPFAETLKQLRKDRSLLDVFE